MRVTICNVLGNSLGNVLGNSLGNVLGNVLAAEATLCAFVWR